MKMKPEKTGGDAQASASPALQVWPGSVADGAGATTNTGRAGGAGTIGIIIVDEYA